MPDSTLPAATRAATASGPAAKLTPRLLSLDALRGFDMFWIVGADEIVHALTKVSNAAPVRFLAGQLDHSDWAGFTFYDLIFPLFVFMAGVSLVFSLSRVLEAGGRGPAAWRIVRRAVLLYGLGILYYGGFATPFHEIRLLGVLQRIALSYLFAALTFLFLGVRGRLAVLGGLLVGYWALMTFVPVPGIGAGHFEQGRNLANWLDQHYLPWRKWDGQWDPEGLLSTLPAIGTCLLGTFAGMLLRDRSISEPRKVLYLVAAGVVLASAGWLWNLQFPVVKKLWTSSFVLVAGGYSCLLLGLFHGIIEVGGLRGWAIPFVWIGMNPITIYMIHNLVDLEKIADRFVGGQLHEALGAAGPLVTTAVVVAITFAICRFLYQRKVFLRL